MTARFLAACAALLLLAAPAAAQTSGDVLFNGFILGSCTVTVGAAGTLELDGDGNQLSSQNPGGAPATATIVTTSIGYRVDVDPPTAFTLEPAGGGTGVAYSASYSATGATILNNVLAGLLSVLGLGTTNLTIHASADRASGVFPPGEYQMPVTVTCDSLL